VKVAILLKAIYRIQCNLNKNSKGIHMDVQKAQIAKAILSKKEQY
jgi:hypothetical protein